MQTELKEVSLETLGNGAAVELFNEELRKVMDNIADPNTAQKASRMITLKVKITPNEERNGAAVEIAASSHLVANKPYGTYFFVGSDGAKVRAYENNPKQPELPGMDKIIDMGGRKE